MSHILLEDKKNREFHPNPKIPDDNTGFFYNESRHKIFHNLYKFGIVIPAIESRLDNLRLALAYLADQTYPIEHLVIVCDGWSLKPEQIDLTLMPTIVSIPKHEPGREQPRNVGVRFLFDSCTHVWFVDSDIIFCEDTLEIYAEGVSYNPNGLIYGPYDWMEPGRRHPQWDLQNDPRWEMFRQNDMEDIHLDNIGVALGCFGGNLVWNIEEFKRVGGFWNDLHMGRCEDGELGIRACSMGVPMSLAKRARGWHISHPIDTAKVFEKNKRDVPMINKRHPELQDKGIIVQDKDGKRFAQHCEGCNNDINTLEYWQHAENCNG